MIRNICIWIKHSKISFEYSWNLFFTGDALLGSKEGVWGPNVEEFQRRFDPELTDGNGPMRLKNLYFLYLLGKSGSFKFLNFVNECNSFFSPFLI